MMTSMTGAEGFVGTRRWLLGCLALVLAAIPAAVAGTGESPWDAYNKGVEAYGARRYSEAFERWQDLVLQPLPRGLRSPVWFQLGNAQFRLGEPFEAGAPEEAVEWWRRSLEAYRTVLERSPRHAAAGHNLRLASERLAQLLRRLGLEAFEAAGRQPLDSAIDLLDDGLGRLDEAVTWQPADRGIQADRDRVASALKGRLIERAAQSEAKGDQEAARATEWGDPEAGGQYQAALDDLGEAIGRPAAVAGVSGGESAEAGREAGGLDRSAREAQSRVRQKLSDLLTRMGRREQRTGEANAKWDTSSAIEPYEAALGYFREAQQVRPDHEEARRGEREARAALGQLRLRMGDTELAEGRDRLARRSPDAAGPLAAALGNFEAALELDSGSVAARSGAEEARRLLPEALVLGGQRDLGAGERVEAERAGEALDHYQEAESAFQQAVDLEPNQSSAQQGLEDVRPRIARVRERVAREADEAARRRVQPGRSATTLEDLLGQVSERQQEREGEWDRVRQRGQKQTGGRRSALDW